MRARQIDCVECLVADRETDNDGDGTEDRHIGGKEEDGHSQSARSSSRIEDTYGRGLLVTMISVTYLLDMEKKYRDCTLAFLLNGCH